MTIDQILSEIDAALNRLACDHIVAGTGDDAIGETLEQSAVRLLDVGTPAARDIAASLRLIRESPASGSDKLSAAMALVGRFASAGRSDAPEAVPAVADPIADAVSTAEEDELATLRMDPEMAELFVGEALDHLGTIEAALLALDERPGDVALLNDIFRPFHTIKGNAGALGLHSVQEVAHRVENLLDLARSGRHRVGAAEVDVILRAVDVLTMMTTDIAKRLQGQDAQPLQSVAVELITQVERIIEGGDAATEERDVAVAPQAVAAQVEDQAVLQPEAARASEPHRRFDDMPGQQSIKVDTRKLDSLIDAVGELIIVQSLIQEDPALAAMVDGRLARNLGQLKRITADLQRNSMALRMVPVRQAFQKVSRVVRDLSRKAGKPVELVLSGEDTELDRKVVEDITDPLMHMVRNSLDHGIEPPEVRASTGKRAQARLALAAYHQGGHIVLEISDDGAGLNTEKILARAIQRGLLPEGATPPAEEIHHLIFQPGFSTAEQITEISGRGVGMDVVRRNIEALRGRVDIRSERGRGTTFLIRLPLTLAVLDGLLVAAGGERFVLPTNAVRESLRPAAAQVHYVQGHPRMVQVRNSVLPLVFLGELFNLAAETDPTRATVVVVEDEGSCVGLVVDDLLSKQEVVIKTLGEMFAAVRGVAGGAILGDGRVGLILDVHGIVGLMRGGRAA